MCVQVERLQVENNTLRERLAAETATVEETTRRLAADASRAQRALENKHAEQMRELRGELLACAPMTLPTAHAVCVASDLMKQVSHDA